MKGLAIHCGASRVTRKQLYGLPQPRPMGPRHAPIAHADFVEELTGALRAYGFNIQDEAFGLGRNGMQIFGVMQVQHDRVKAFKDGGHLVGFRGSHDQSFPRGVCAGNRVFVCDNLMFSGEFAFKTPHTINIVDRLQVLLDGLMAELEDSFRRFNATAQNFKRTRISDETAAHTIIEMARRDIIANGDIAHVAEEWYSPSHEEHGDKTLWRLQNAATEVLKIRTPSQPRLPIMMGSATNKLQGRGPRLEMLLDEVAAAA